jgi:adenylate cyclase
VIKGRRQLHTALFFGIGLAASCLALFAYEFHVFQRLELTTVDTRFSIRGDLPAPKDVVVVGVDDNTFGDLNLQWPFPRSVEAKVIDHLAAARAKVIAEDIQYTEPTTPMPGCGALCARLAKREDEALINSIYEADHKHSKVVLADTEVENGITKLQPAEKSLGAGVGNGNYILEADGVIRRLPYAIQKLQTFPVVSAERALGRRLRPSDVPGKRSVARW